MKSWVKNLEHLKFEKGEYSQYFQDQLLNYVFQNIDEKIFQKFCVEFGYNENKISNLANSTDLIKNYNWDYIFFDAIYENNEDKIYKEFLTTENILSIFEKFNIPKRLGYISIDIDSLDFWLFKELLGEYKPIIYSVEYNPQFPINCAITSTNNPNLVFQNDCAYGASLKALNLLAEEFNYSLLWVVPTLDAFFIRSDVIDDGTENISFPLKKFKSYTNLPNHPRLIDISGERTKNFLDYETLVSSNYDYSKSIKSAEKVVSKYLIGLGNLKTKFYRVRLYLRKILLKLLRSNKITKILFIKKILSKILSFINYFDY